MAETSNLQQVTSEAPFGGKGDTMLNKLTCLGEKKTSFDVHKLFFSSPLLN